VRLTLDLTAHTFQQNEAALIPFSDITDFKLVSDAGVYYDSQADAAPLHSLIVETNQGQHVLLPKELGSMQQKLQLLSQLRAIVTA
jgi:hypothetical protein